MKKKYHLAFDLGAESGRAVVGELTGDKMNMKEINRFYTGTLRMGEHTYCDFFHCYREILHSLKIFHDAYGSELASLGVDSWGCDYGLLDAKGRLLSLPYSYRDKRVNNTDKIIEQKIGSERLYQLTGIQMLPINTLNQIIGMIRQEDQTIRLSHHLLFIGDLMHYLLTGRIATEYTMLSISQLYNNIEKRYEDEVFDAFGIHKEIQTEVIYAGDEYGMTTEAIGMETGIRPTRVITPAVHDTASGIAAVPALEKEDWYVLSSGTWSILGTETDDIIINDKMYEYSFSNSAGVLGKNLVLKNVMGLWIIQRCYQEWVKTNHALSYSDIVDMAKRADPFKAFIEPDDFMFFNPDCMHQAVNGYLKKTGQQEIDRTDIGQIARIVFESLAMKYRFTLENIEAATGKEAAVLYFIGGGIKNRMLNQFTANATGKLCATGSDESCIMGNLLTQCYGCNMLDSLQAMRKVARNSIAQEMYTPEEAAEWTREYGRFLHRTKLI